MPPTGLGEQGEIIFLILFGDSPGFGMLEVGFGFVLYELDRNHVTNGP